MRLGPPTAILIVCAGIMQIGSSARGGVDTCGPATLTIDASLCGSVGSQFVAEISMTDAPFEIVGGQYLLEYSSTSLQVVACDAGDAPFDVLFACDTDTLGSILASTIISPFGRGTSEDRVMLRVTFRVLSRASDFYIRFDSGNPIPITLSGFGGGAVRPFLQDAEVNSDDLAGYAELQNCFSGDGVSAPALCRCAFDRDGDRDVDEVDAAAFIAGWTGPKPVTCAVISDG